MQMFYLLPFNLAEPDPDYDPVDLGDDDGSGNVSNAPDFTGIDNFFKELFEIYNDLNVDIVNNSYGYSGNIIDYTEAQVRYAFPKTIEEMAQSGVPDSDKTIYVWAAGNAGGYADQGVRLLPVQNSFQEWLITYQKFKATPLQ